MLKLALAIHRCVVARLNLDASLGNQVAPSRLVCLLHFLDVAGVFQQLYEMVRSDCLAHPKLFRSRVNSRGTSKHVALQQVINSAGEDRPVVNEKAEYYRGQNQDGDDYRRTDEPMSNPSPEAVFRLSVGNDARLGPRVLLRALPWRG